MKLIFCEILMLDHLRFMHKLLFILFLLFQACNESKTENGEAVDTQVHKFRVGSTDTSLTIITNAGLIEPELLEAYQAIALKYNFSFLVSVKCVTSRSEHDSMKKYNGLVYHALDEKYGPQMELRIRMGISHILDSIHADKLNINRK